MPTVRTAATNELLASTLEKAIRKVLDEADARRTPPTPGRRPAVVASADAFAAPRRGASSAEVALTKVVVRLSRELEGLEEQNTGKLAEADRLVAAIAEREAELETEHRRQRRIGMVGAFMGLPAVVGLSLVELKRTDGRLTQLRSTLASAQAEQQRLHGRMDAYVRVKASVVASIERLRSSAQASLPPLPRGTPQSVRKVFAQVEQTSVQAQALRALQQERQLLTELREDAGALGADLSQALARLKTDLSAAARALGESQAGTRVLIESLLSEDPNAAALEQLRGQARQVVEKRLRPVVARLVAPAPAALRPELSKRLLSAMTGGLFT